MNSQNENTKLYYKILFKDYPDIVRVKDLQKMLPKMGKNKIYKLLQEKEVLSKKIGRDYYIPKISVIEYLIKWLNRNYSVVKNVSFNIVKQVYIML